MIQMLWMIAWEGVDGGDDDEVEVVVVVLWGLAWKHLNWNYSSSLYWS